MGVYNHADYDWVGVVYPDASHGSYDQAELDLFDVDKRYPSLKSAAVGAKDTVGSALIEVIGSWTNPDTEGSIFNNGWAAYMVTTLTVVNVRPSARWNSVWNPNHYRLDVTVDAFYPWCHNTILLDGVVSNATGDCSHFYIYNAQLGSYTLESCVFTGGTAVLGTNDADSIDKLYIYNSIFSEIGHGTFGTSPTNSTGVIENSTFANVGLIAPSYGLPIIRGANLVGTNNVFYQGVTTDYAKAPVLASASDYNFTDKAWVLLGDNSVNGISDPFLDSANADFRIAETSPLFDAGVIITGVTEDIIGVSRPQGQYHDIGAFEFDAGGQTGVPVSLILLNLVSGSRCVVELASDGTPVLDAIEATGSTLEGSFAYIEDVAVITKVRKSSPGDPIRYRAYKAPGVISSDGLTVFVDQQIDEVLN